VDENSRIEELESKVEKLTWMLNQIAKEYTWRWNLGILNELVAEDALQGLADRYDREVLGKGKDAKENE